MMDKQREEIAKEVSNLLNKKLEEAGCYLAEMSSDELAEPIAKWHLKRMAEREIKVYKKVIDLYYTTDAYVDGKDLDLIDKEDVDELLQSAKRQLKELEG